VVDKNLDLLHLVYSDGLASVSVFIEKDKGVSSHLYGASSMGAVNAFGNLVGEHFVTVVGEVPAKTVQLMAQSTSRIH
jgi:sigma-E factor negative regulatory protein RseB